jgi:polyisoprenoid-binding protein YceI
MAFRPPAVPRWQPRSASVTDRSRLHDGRIPASSCRASGIPDALRRFPKSTHRVTLNNDSFNELKEVFVKPQHIVLCLLIVGLAGSAAAATTYTIDAAHSDVAFKVRHLIANVPGRFGDFDGTITADWQNLDDSSVKFIIKAASIDTRNEDRDKHLRSADFFDVEKYPEITFVSDRITKAGDNSYSVTGKLTMHGVTKEVTLPVKYLGEMADPWGNVKAGFQIVTTLDRTDYGIVWNKALETGGLLLGEEIEVEINLEVAKK